MTAGGAPPTLVKSGQTSGNYVASQLANQGGDWMIVLNDAGDPPLRYNGTTWATLNYTIPAKLVEQHRLCCWCQGDRYR